MTSEDDWTLPNDYWAERHADGRVTLWRKDHSVWDFRRGTPQKAIEAWAEAYAEGRDAGVAEGRTLGRDQLAADLRTLICTGASSADHPLAFSSETPS